MSQEQFEEKFEGKIKTISWDHSENKADLLSQSLANCTQLYWTVKRNQNLGKDLPEGILELANNYGGTGTLSYLEKDPLAKYFKKFDPWWPKNIEFELLNYMDGTRALRMFAFELGSQQWIAKPIRNLYNGKSIIPKSVLPYWEIINEANKNIEHNFRVPLEVQRLVDENFPNYKIKCEVPRFIYTDQQDNKICIYPYYGYLNRAHSIESMELFNLNREIVTMLIENGYNTQELCINKSFGKVNLVRGKSYVDTSIIDDTLYLLDFEGVVKLRN